MRYPTDIFNIIQDYIKDPRIREAKYYYVLIDLNDLRFYSDYNERCLQKHPFLNRLNQISIKFFSQGPEGPELTDEELEIYELRHWYQDRAEWLTTDVEEDLVRGDRRLRRAKAKETRIKKRARREAQKLVKLI